MAQDRHNQQPDRRANRTILGRTLFLMVIFGVVAFIPLFATLYDLQITRHDELEAKALDQQTSDVEAVSYTHLRRISAASAEPQSAPGCPAHT